MWIAEGTIGTDTPAYVTVTPDSDRVEVTVTRKEGKGRWSGIEVVTITLKRSDFRMMARTI